MRRLFPLPFYNPITLTGVMLSGICFALILFLTVLEALSRQPKPYMGVIILVILPAFLFLGVMLIVLGAIRAQRRRRAGKAFSIQLDLGVARHRTAFLVFVVGGITFLVASSFGSYHAYEYTDSPRFCGSICHPVMEPEDTTYHFSPHAKVECAECHIGPGAGWFVRSKLSGMYQVYATLFNKFPRPIPTPIENLRPAQETCEQCHWPAHFLSEKLRVHHYFLSDEGNTRWTLNLLMKTGGGDLEVGPTSGIHWHMNISHKVVYAHLDRQRLVIPWVSSTDRTGKETVYRSLDHPLTEAELQALPKRRMDCVDCHNRPAHIFHPPARSVDVALHQGWIDQKLPYARSVSVRALREPYATKSEAREGIRSRIEGFYRSTYPEVAAGRSEAVEQAIGRVQSIYERNFFPDMKVSWKTFPDHIGHLYAPGCFRCHDGRHVSQEGKVLSKDCNECHTILAQEMTATGLRLSLEGIEYRHPVDVGNAWMEMHCHECHGPRDGPPEPVRRAASR